MENGRVAFKLRDVADLLTLAHDSRAANPTAESCFIEHHPHLRRTQPGQGGLAPSWSI